MFLLSLFISFIALILILVDHLEKKKKNFSDKIINKNNDLNKLSIQKPNTLTLNTKPFSNIPTTIYESETKILDKTEFNMNGYNKDGFNRFGFDYKGFDKDGFNKFGFNKDGINRDGFNKFGFDKHGFDKFGFDRNGLDKNGFDILGFDKDGFNKQGISIHNSICKNTNTSSSQDFNKKDFYTDNKEIDIKKVKEQPLNNDLSNLADFPNIDTTNSTLHFASQTSSKKIETSYSYIMDYYSKSKNIEVGEEEEKNRNLVYDFKDGKNKDYFVNLIKDYMIKNNILKENLTIVPIPASSSSKNHKRFYQLFKELSDSLSIENGFEYIKVVSDREAKHLSKNRECCDKNYEIDYDKIKNKNILLIDDIITTGTGFSKLSNELLKNGSREVNGLFLAKTVKTSNENKIEKQNNSPSSSKKYETTSLNNYKKSNPYEQYGVILGEDGHYYNNIGDKIISPDRYFEAIERNKQRISN